MAQHIADFQCNRSYSKDRFLSSYKIAVTNSSLDKRKHIHKQFYQKLASMPTYSKNRFFDKLRYLNKVNPRIIHNKPCESSIIFPVPKGEDERQ